MATIKQRGDSYKITVSCGYDLNGKQIRRHLTWTPEPGMTKRQLQKELDRQAVLFEEKCRNGQVLDGNIKFAEFAEKWFTDYAEKQLRPTTIAGYRWALKRTLPAIGHIRLDKLRPHHLMAFYDNLAESGIREDTLYRCSVDFKAFLREQHTTAVQLAERAGVGIRTLYGLNKGNRVKAETVRKIETALELSKPIFEPVDGDAALSSNTISHYHKMLSSMLSTAVKWQLIYDNPCLRVDPPKVEHSEAHYLDEVQAAHLLDLLDDEPIVYRTMITLLLHTGLRRGELCGLEWDDINFDLSLLDVQRTSLYLPEKGVFVDETKNNTSRRVLKLTPDAVQLLKRYRMWQNSERLRIGDQWAEEWEQHPRLFTTWDGKPLHPSTVTGWFHTFAAHERNAAHCRRYKPDHCCGAGCDTRTRPPPARFTRTPFSPRTPPHPRPLAQRPPEVIKLLLAMISPSNKGQNKGQLTSPPQANISKALQKVKEKPPIRMNKRFLIWWRRWGSNP